MKNHFFLLGACIVLASCSTGDGPAVSRMLGGSSQALVFLNCKAVSEDKIEFEFSKAVTVKTVDFSPELPIASVERGRTVGILLKENATPGMLVTADMVAEDEKRNSINVLVSFRTRNNHMPKLVINELCTEYANAAAGKKEEFIELKIKSAGNLGAMRVFILGNTKLTVYDFSPVEVKKDDYVVLHLRKWDELCKDELSDNLDVSRSVNSSPNARDFWIPGDKKLMQKAATTVYVLDQDDKVLDAVMLCATQDSPWAKDYYAEAASFLFEQGEWKSAEGQIASPTAAVNSSATTNTRTICRDETVEDTNTAKDWYITYTSCATPGKPNNPRRWN